MNYPYSFVIGSMYANSRNMSIQCFRAISLFSEHSAQAKYALILSRLPSRKLNTWQDCSLVQAAKEIKLLAAVKLATVLQKRNMSDSHDNPNDDKRKKGPFLMDFEPVIRPEIFLTLKNWILAKFIIQPYLDKDFTLKDFSSGSKQALENVSACLSEGDVDSLQGLVAADAITEIKKNLACFSLKERQDLLIKVKDVLFAFPYQIGIIFDDNNERRFAEITVVYHCLSGFEDLKAQGKMLTDAVQADIKICNYRFIREYTKGVNSDWTINRLGHYKVLHFEN